MRRVLWSLMAVLPARIRALWLISAILAMSAAFSEILVAASIFAAIASFAPSMTPGVGGGELLRACGFILLRNVLAGASAAVQAEAVSRSIASCYARIVSGLLTMPFKRQSTISTATLQQNAFIEVDAAYRELASAAVTLASELLVALCLVTALTWLMPGPAIAVLVLGVTVMAVVMRAIGRASRAAGAETHRMQAEMIRNLLDVVGGMREIRTAQKESVFLERAIRPSERMARALARALTLLALPRVVNESLIVLSLFSLFAILGRGSAEPQALLAFAALLGYSGFRLAPSANRILAGLQQLQRRRHGASAALALLSEVGSESPVEPRPRAFAFEREIALRDVTFSYEGRAVPALRGATLTVGKGECVAVIGPNGSGKSTLLDLLAGVLTPDSGAITVDGRALSEWRSFMPPLVQYVPQVPFFFDSRIEANIVLAGVDEHVDRDSLSRATQLARIGNLLHSAQPLGERGNRLSGGQRQRVALARALHGEADVLLFDEATSALDPEMEAHFEETLQALRGRTTIVMATQNIVAARRCDRIIVLEDGAVVATGTFETLLRESETVRRLSMPQGRRSVAVDLPA
jgi:ABC-type multidrug transport system fused ATPase/permease subunit